MRRVRDANPSHLVPDEQGELFPAWRHHAVFTDSPLPMVDAEADHRRHAVSEQVIADLKAGPLAHLPSARFTANGAWLVLAAIAFNLTRSAGALASTFHARATTATTRAQLINIPARPTRSARRVTLRATNQLALATRLATVLHRSNRATRTRRCLIDPASQVRPDSMWKCRAQADHSHPGAADPNLQDQLLQTEFTRWIRA